MHCNSMLDSGQPLSGNILIQVCTAIVCWTTVVRWHPDIGLNINLPRSLTPDRLLQYTTPRPDAGPLSVSLSLCLSLPAGWPRELPSVCMGPGMAMLTPAVFQFIRDRRFPGESTLSLQSLLLFSQSELCDLFFNIQFLCTRTNHNYLDFTLKG